MPSYSNMRISSQDWENKRQGKDNKGKKIPGKGSGGGNMPGAGGGMGGGGGMSSMGGGMGGGKSKPKKPSPTYEDIQEKFAPKAVPSKYHKGGKVRKTGVAMVKKGERVLTIAQQKSAGLKNSGKKKASTRKRVASKG